ncbi:MAG: fimbrillin family protein [Mediterranea sp.]|jgi:uncharacterized protein (TIGR02145 family)|nr:fimbrillin family protein [Mediterranea sp.]
MIKTYMINLKTLSIALCQLSIILSCSQENEKFLGEDSESITFSVDLIQEEWGSSNSSSSRISNTAWTAGDEIGIYMLPTTINDLTDNDVWKNRKHTVDASLKLNPDGDVNTLYYPLNSTGVRFIAYYPYASSVAPIHKLTFDFTDQNNKSKKESKDFCFHRGTTSYATGTPSLVFKHKFSKILINISKGSGISSCSGIMAKLDNMPASATVDLNKLAADATGENAISNLGISTTATEIKAYTHSGSTNDAATIEAIIAPHSGTGNFIGRKFIFTTADGKTMTYNLPDNITFEAGKSYTFSLTMVAPKPSTKVSDGMTNCYIVAQNTEFKFPVSRAYIYSGGKFTDMLHVDNASTYTGGFDAAVVWDDNSVINGTPTVSGSGNTAEITIKTTTDTSKSGNAVIKICKSGNTTPVWSYHIWVTAYDPVQNTFTNTDKDNKYTWIFMDRNLGAIKADNTFDSRGLYYQWGRKDPFAGVIGTAGSAASSSFYFGGSYKVSGSTKDESIIESIQKPTTFFVYKDASYNWFPAIDDELWGHSGNKTIYDPCPVGWRVPVNYGLSDDTSPWYDFSAKTFVSNATAAADWSVPSGANNAIYPVAGSRNYKTGNPLNVDNTGYYWSASPYGNDYFVSSMDFNTGNININSKTSRAFGNSVRCVKE